jgi:hypothetical protein
VPTVCAHRPTPPHTHTVQCGDGDAERQTLRRLLTTGSALARTLSHVRILFKADASADGPACIDEQIRDALDVRLATILRVRRAFATGGRDAARQRKPTRRQYRRAPMAAKRRTWSRWPVARHRRATPAGACGC